MTEDLTWAVGTRCNIYIMYHRHVHLSNLINQVISLIPLKRTLQTEDEAWSRSSPYMRGLGGPATRPGLLAKVRLVKEGVNATL